MKELQTCVLLISMFMFLLTAYLLICRYNEVQTERYTKADPMVLELHAMLAAVHPEGANKISVAQSDSSYTINKRSMHLCVKDRKGKYFSKNMLMYVALHELAHVLCDEIGHTPKFHKIFDDILDKAVEIGLYNPEVPPNLNYIDECGGE